MSLWRDSDGKLMVDGAGRPINSSTCPSCDVFSCESFSVSNTKTGDCGEDCGAGYRSVIKKCGDDGSVVTTTYTVGDDGSCTSADTCCDGTDAPCYKYDTECTPGGCSCLDNSDTSSHCTGCYVKVTTDDYSKHSDGSTVSIPFPEALLRYHVYDQITAGSVTGSLIYTETTHTNCKIAKVASSSVIFTPAYAREVTGNGYTGPTHYVYFGYGGISDGSTPPISCTYDMATGSFTSGYRNYNEYAESPQPPVMPKNTPQPSADLVETIAESGQWAGTCENDASTEDDDHIKTRTRNDMDALTSPNGSSCFAYSYLGGDNCTLTKFHYKLTFTVPSSGTFNAAWNETKDTDPTHPNAQTYSYSGTPGECHESGWYDVAYPTDGSDWVNASITLTDLVIT